MAAYFAALDPMTLVRALPGNVAQGIIWGIMALGVYITFRILDFADLTVDGSLATGGAVAVMLIRAGVNPALALVFAFLAGMAAGFVTGVLHTFFGIPGILASILTQIGLYSVNLGIMGKSNQAVNVMQYKLVASLRYVTGECNWIFFLKLILAALILIVYIAFRFKQISGWSAGVCAVLGLLSTLVVTYGSVVLIGFEIDSNFMAVILTLLGYAINDTIIIYDRIRENQTLLPGIQIEDLVNISSSQSLRRSIRTSVTTFSSMLIVTIVSLVMGLDSILSFSVPMMVGIAMGTYNSICFVPSLWVWWQKKRGISVLAPVKTKKKANA